MNTKISKKPGPWMLALLLAAAGAGLACQQEAGSSPAATPVASAPAPAAGVQTASLRKIEDPKKVCMVNNTVFEKDQIPVQVSGKTYYGCCEMCKERLAKDAAARTATDSGVMSPLASRARRGPLAESSLSCSAPIEIAMTGWLRS